MAEHNRHLSDDPKKKKISQMISWILLQRHEENKAKLRQLEDHKFGHDETMAQTMLFNLLTSESGTIRNCRNRFEQLPKGIRLSPLKYGYGKHTEL